MNSPSRSPAADADEECAVFYGLSTTELTVVGLASALLALPPALLCWLILGLWSLPLVFFAGLAAGIRFSAMLAGRWRSGKPHRWLERQAISWIYRCLLHPAIPTQEERWVPWRLKT